MRRKPVDSGADRGMRAYVTSGGTASNDARAAPCVRATDLTPRACGELNGSRHTSGAKVLAQHAPPVGGDLGVGLG